MRVIGLSFNLFRVWRSVISQWSGKFYTHVLQRNTASLNCNFCPQNLNTSVLWETGIRGQFYLWHFTISFQSILGSSREPVGHLDINSIKFCFLKSVDMLLIWKIDCEWEWNGVTFLSWYFAICLNESNGVVVVAHDMIAVDEHLILVSWKQAYVVGSSRGDAIGVLRDETYLKLCYFSEHQSHACKWELNKISVVAFKW